MEEIGRQQRDEIQEILKNFNIKDEVPYTTPRELLADPLKLFSEEDKNKIKALMGLALEIS